MASQVISRPSTYICSGLRVPVLWKLSETTSFTRAALVTRSVLGFSLAGWHENQIIVCNTGPPLAAYRVVVLSADPPLLSGPGTATGNLYGINLKGGALNKFPGRKRTSAVDQMIVVSVGQRRDPSPRHLHLIAIRSCEHTA